MTDAEFAKAHELQREFIRDQIIEQRGLQALDHAERAEIRTLRIIQGEPPS